MSAKGMLLTRQQADSRHQAMIVDLHRTLSVRSEKQPIADNQAVNYGTTYASQVSDQDVDDIITIIAQASSSIKHLEDIVAHRESIIEQQNKIIDQMRLIEKETGKKLTAKEEECNAERQRADRVETLLVSCEKHARHLEEQSAASQTNLSKLTRAIRDSLKPSGLLYPEAATSQQSTKATVKVQTISARQDSGRVDAMAV